MKKIQSLREKLKISRKQFASELGISREYLRLIEIGKAKNPSVDVMKKISYRLGVTPQELFFED